MRMFLLHAALALVSANAVAQETPPAPPASFQSWYAATSAKQVAAETCPCGTDCKCHLPFATRFDGVANSPDGLYLGVSGPCVLCPKAEANAVASGVPVAILTGAAGEALGRAAGAEGFPVWALIRDGKLVKSWDGVSNPDGVRIMAKHREAVVNEGYSAAPPPASGQPGPHSHRCDSCATIWTHDARTITNDVAAHSCPNCRRTQRVHYTGPGSYRNR